MAEWKQTLLSLLVNCPDDDNQNTLTDNQPSLLFYLQPKLIGMPCLQNLHFGGAAYFMAAANGNVSAVSKSAWEKMSGGRGMCKGAGRGKKGLRPG